jgi:CTP:molybdopterin cytidylyltransferase MocA/nucleoside-triphosphatase THEP1
LTRYFASTNKKHLVITGDLGSGKSTLLSSCITPAHGFYTKAIKGESVTFFDIESGQSVVIGKYDNVLGKMVADDVGFEKACCLLQRAIVRGQLLYFDEIGYIEKTQPRFLALINKAFDQKQVFAVLRKAEEQHINAIKSRSDVCVVDLTAQNAKIGCVVMASGRAKRFGKNKLLQNLSGKLVAQYAVDNAISGNFDKCLLLTRIPEVKEQFQNQLPCILHDKPTRSEAIKLAVENMCDMDGIMFIQADQPLVSGESIANLIFAFRQNPTKSFRLAYGDKQAAPTIFPQRLFNSLLTLPPHHGGNYIFSCGETPQPIYAQRECELFDIDTPEDLLALSKFI